MQLKNLFRLRNGTLLMRAELRRTWLLPVLAAPLGDEGGDRESEKNEHSAEQEGRTRHLAREAFEGETRSRLGWSDHDRSEYDNLAGWKEGKESMKKEKIQQRISDESKNIFSKKKNIN